MGKSSKQNLPFWRKLDNSRAALMEYFAALANMAMALWTASIFFTSGSYHYSPLGTLAFGAVCIDAIGISYQLYRLASTGKCDGGTLAFRVFDFLGQSFFLISTTASVNLLVASFSIPITLPALFFMAPLCFFLGACAWGVDAVQKYNSPDKAERKAALFSGGASLVMVGITVALVLAAVGLTGPFGVAALMGVSIIASAVLYGISVYKKFKQARSAEPKELGGALANMDDAYKPGYDNEPSPDNTMTPSFKDDLIKSKLFQSQRLLHNADDTEHEPSNSRSPKP